MQIHKIIMTLSVLLLTATGVKASIPCCNTGAAHNTVNASCCNGSIMYKHEANALYKNTYGNTRQAGGKKITVGLVLCGGGAKGVAHIGVIKRLEEIGIRPDIVVGTSMGALVGGMYAMGYNSAQLDSIVTTADWDYILSDNVKREDVAFTKKLSDEKYLINLPFYNLRSKAKEETANMLYSLPGGYVSGKNVLNLLNGLAIGYQDSIDFKNLPIPFACIATDLETGSEVILDHGYLPEALRASMAIPGFFAPVVINGQVLVDGGVVNNFPTDVARHMGANIIIGVDVQSDLAKAEQLTSIDQVLMQLISLLGNDRFIENQQLVDIYIKPDVSKFGTLSFNPEAVQTLMQNGYTAACEKDTLLVALHGIIGEQETDTPVRKAQEIYTSQFRVETIECEGVDDWDKNWLLKQASIKEHSVITGAQINRAISIFNGTQAFAQVSYKLSALQDSTDTYRLKFIFEQGPTNVLSIGARYDTEEAAAMLFHLGVHQYDFHGSKLNATARLSYNPYLTLGYSYVFRKFPRLDLEYTVAKKDINIYSGSNSRSRNNISYIYNGFSFSFANIKYLRMLDVQLGMRVENFKFTKFLTDIESLRGTSLKAKGYASIFARAVVDSRDSKHFPASGTYFDIDANYYLIGFHSNFNKFSAIKASWRYAADLGKGFALLPQVYSRTAFGNSSEIPFVNFAGGSEEGRYIAHQLPFIGINYANAFDNSVAILRTDLRKKIGKKHYVSAICNYMRIGHKIDELTSLKRKGYWGLGAQYSLDTILGPVSFNLHWSDYNSKVGAYLSIGYFF